MAPNMKPTVIAASQASAASGAGGSTSNSSNGNGNGNVTSAGAGVNIPISREYMGIGGEHNASPQQHHQQHYAQQRLPPQFYNSQTAYGSPRQQQVPPNQQQQHFQVSDWLKIDGASPKVVSLPACLYVHMCICMLTCNLAPDKVAFVLLMSLLLSLSLLPLYLAMEI